MQPACHYSIDANLIRGRRIFICGWIFHTTQTINQVTVELTLKSGEIVCLCPDYGKRRADVAAGFPDRLQAGASGFIYYGSWTGGSAESAQIVARMENGGEERVPVPAPGTPDAGKAGNNLQYGAGAAGTGLIRRAGWSPGELWKRGRRCLGMLVANEVSLAEQLRRIISSSGNGAAVLIIDHDLGGGANLYRNTRIDEYRGSGKNILLLNFQLHTLQFRLSLQGPDATGTYLLDNLDDLSILAEKGLIQEVFFNNAVSFAEPLQIADLLLSLAKNHDIPLKIALHDYYTICPSHFLIDQTGSYCGIPSVDTCGRCLASNEEDFVFLCDSGDIIGWRERWGGCLELAEEVICFSAASRDILLKAYPCLDKKRLPVIPHRVHLADHRKPDINLDKTLHIGVLGEIGEHKGVDVINQLAREISIQGHQIRISIIGTMEWICCPDIIDETGPYEHHEVADLIDRTGANVFLFPSIWPETFSFVAEELMALGVPLVCFDLGAPAERVAGYHRGKVLALDTDCPTLLKNLIDFHADMRSLADAGEQAALHTDGLC